MRTSSEGKWRPGKVLECGHGCNADPIEMASGFMKKLGLYDHYLGLTIIGIYRVFEIIEI